MTGNRVVVTGLPASGKTTFSKQLAETAGLAHVETDRMYFGPYYAVRPTFLDELQQALDQDRWLVDCVGYAESRDLVWRQADTLVWIDVPWYVAGYRAVKRTWGRLREGVELLPGCKESWLGWASAKHPVRLTLTKHRSLRREIEERIAQPEWEHLEVVRLRSRAEVAAYLAQTTERSEPSGSDAKG